MARDSRAFFSRHSANPIPQTSAPAAAGDTATASKKRPLQQQQQQQLQKHLPPIKKKLVISSNAGSNVLKYRASNIVADLKESLEKEDFKEFKKALMGYKETKDVSELLEVVKKHRVGGKLSGEQVRT